MDPNLTFTDSAFPLEQYLAAYFGWDIETMQSNFFAVAHQFIGAESPVTDSWQMDRAGPCRTQVTDVNVHCGTIPTSPSIGNISEALHLGNLYSEDPPQIPTEPSSKQTEPKNDTSQTSNKREHASSRAGHAKTLGVSSAIGAEQSSSSQRSNEGGRVPQAKAKANRKGKRKVYDGMVEKMKIVEKKVRPNYWFYRLESGWVLQPERDMQFEKKTKCQTARAYHWKDRDRWVKVMKGNKCDEYETFDDLCQSLR